MKNKYLSTALIGCAIAFATIPLHATESISSESSDSIFVCGIQAQTPTMFSYTPGEVNLTPLMSWNSEYLLPGQSGAEVCKQTAVKLQESYQQEEAKYLKTATTEEQNLVCLVDEEDKNCLDEASQKLFSVNSKYDASCVLENKAPIDCVAQKVRGIYSFNDEPYQPLWWPW